MFICLHVCYMDDICMWKRLYMYIEVHVCLIKHVIIYIYVYVHICMCRYMIMCVYL